MPGTRKLGRKTAHRNLMLRGMVTYLLENGKIETTLTRAKEVAALTEKMITVGKKNTLAARRQAMAFITKEDVVSKLFSVIAPEYADRNGGYTQIYKLGPRRGDAAEMALIRLVKEAEEEKKEEKPKKGTSKKASAKKAPAKKAAPKKDESPKEEKAEEVKEPEVVETEAVETEAVETETPAPAAEAEAASDQQATAE